MKKVAQGLVAFLVLAVAAGTVLAKDGEAKKKKERKAKQDTAMKVVRVPKGIELSDAQQQKLSDLNKLYAPKLAELRKAEKTDETKAQMKELRKEIKDALTAMLTEEQRVKLAEKRSNAKKDKGPKKDKAPKKDKPKKEKPKKEKPKKEKAPEGDPA